MENLKKALERYAITVGSGITDLYNQDDRHVTGALISTYFVQVLDDPAGYVLEFTGEDYRKFWYRWGHGPTAKTPAGYDYELRGITEAEQDFEQAISEGVAADLEELLKGITL